jgi:thioesterase domain-containing protein
MSALAILSAWALLHLNLGERGTTTRLVVQRSTLDFTAPVDGDFTATSTLPAPAPWNRFLATLERHGRARVTVVSSIACASTIGASHVGTYVALRL